MIDLIAILDRSGSMHGKETDVIKGFNNFIEEQRKLPGDACVTLVLFDTKYEVVHNRVALKDVPVLTAETYKTQGYTALLDAVGKTLKSAESAKKAIAFIFTDGEENSSREYSKAQIKELVEARKKAGWEVHFIGADVDAFAGGAAMGIDPQLILRTTATKQGIADTTAYLSTNSARYRSSHG